MTKQDFIRRIDTAYQLDLITEPVLNLAQNWCDGMMRLEGGQINYFTDLLERESKRTGRFGVTLANDELGYKVIQLLAILTHPCQQCTEDPKAWHTRRAFCKHKEPNESHR